MLRSKATQSQQVLHSFNPGGVENPNTYPVTVRVVQVESVKSLFPVANPFSNGAVDINDQSKKRKLSLVHEKLAMEEGHQGQICDKLRWRTELDKITARFPDGRRAI